jgi:glycosyltransferase involved in cell wall biosynthesis
MRNNIGEKITVCLLTYNHVEVIESTLRSILDQTITGYEVIVSDDCSTDGTWERILKLAAEDSRIKPVRTPYNMGMPGNANFVVAQSDRPYIALLHHDDLYRKDLLAKWAGVFERNEDVGFVFNPYDVPDAEHLFGPRFSDERLEGSWFLEQFLFARWGCPVRGTAMIRRSLWVKLGGMREHFNLLADVDLWMRLSGISAVGYVNEPVIKPRTQRPDYYPDIYTGKQWHWKRQTIMYEIYAENYKEHYKLSTLIGLWRWWKFRTRLSLETAKWLAYAVVRRKWRMIENCADSATPHDQIWLRGVRYLLFTSTRSHTSKRIQRYASLMKDIIKRLMPEAVLVFIHSFKLARLRREFAALSMGETFSKIYREKLWGGGKDEFVSGSGSSGKVAEIYMDYVCRFIRDNGIESVVDLGCGDFRVGRVIAQVAPQYTGIDVVPELIAHHVVNYSAANVEFRCLDITKENLPIGDLCLVRQVLQHLSNSEIALVLRKLSIYRYVLITEHFPEMNATFSANKDKPHGPDTRLVDHSAVVLTAPPFSLQHVHEVLTVQTNDLQQCAGDTFRTFLFTGRDRLTTKTLLSL